VDFALGSDTGGSTRVPASNCGIWGFRPSHGFVSVAGVNPLAPSFDTVGVLAQSADVLAKVGLVLLSGAPLSASKPATIYLIREAFALADADVQEALSEPMRRLRETFGGAVRESSLQELLADDVGRSFATWADTFCAIQWAEIKSCLGAWIANARPEFGPEIAASFQLVNELDRRRIAEALQRREQYFRSLLEFLGPDDLLCIPTTPALAPRKGDPPKTQFEWKRVLSSHTGSNEHCRHRPPAASVAPTSRRRRRTSGLIVTREAWTGLILVAGGEECWSRIKSALNNL
jgi:amidase